MQLRVVELVSFQYLLRCVGSGHVASRQLRLTRKIAMHMKLFHVLRDILVNHQRNTLLLNWEQRRDMLDLYVWGQAFELPSIDPECLAIITYLHHAAPADSWRIIPFNDPAASPLDHLPALDHDGNWSNGFRQIVAYLTSHSLCRNLDAHLSPAQKADSIAYSAHISAHTALLLDVSLYLSAANWSATTRPAYSKLLPFPLVWTIPPLLRAEAARRVEHLGLAELDSDFDPSSALHLATGRDVLPESFRRNLPVGSKKTVREEMTPEQVAAIRLAGLTEDSLSLLNDLLGPEGEPLRLLGSDTTSLDCLAFGHLALLHDTPVPRAFVKDWLQEKAPRLISFLTSMRVSSSDLPFTPPTSLGVLHVGARTLETVALNGPEFGAQLVSEVRQRSEEGGKSMTQSTVLLAMGILAAGAAAGYGYHFYKSLQPFGLRTQVWRASRGSKLSQFGELGFMLDSALGPVPSSLGGNPASQGQFVDTDSEVD